MTVIRIMPCLGMKERRVVKGVHFVDLQDAGDPVENAAFYQLEGYDLALTRAIADAVDLPIIASGGAGALEHFSRARYRAARRSCSRLRCFTAAPCASWKSRSICRAGGLRCGYSSWTARTPLIASSWARPRTVHCAVCRFMVY